MLNSSIESAVTASSARRSGEKAASAPAEPATSETEVSVRSFSKRSWLYGPAGGKKKLVGSRREKTPLSARQGDDPRWSSRPDHQYPFQYGHFLRDWERKKDYLLIKGAMEPAMDEDSTPICSWSRNRTGVQICHQLKGPKLIYK